MNEYIRLAKETPDYMLLDILEHEIYLSRITGEFTEGFKALTNILTIRINTEDQSLQETQKAFESHNALNDLFNFEKRQS